MHSSASDSVQSPPIPLNKDSRLTVTVVICTRNRPAFLRKCLEGVAQLAPAPDEVIVVDNTPGDKETQLVVQEFAASYRVEQTPGASRARNRGLTECNSEIIAYLDDDSVPDVNWLRFLLEPFANPSVVLVTGKVITSLSRTWDSIQEPHRSLSNKDHLWFEIATFGGLGLGPNMALRKSACTGWKVFDERLGPGASSEIGEEHYSFACILSRGYCAEYVPEAIVYHPPPRRSSVEQEALRAIAYWWLLFFDFPGHRLDLIRFLFRRLRHKPLTWRRDPPGLGPIITSGWRVRIRAVLGGTLLYLRIRKAKDE